jgi:crotonobetainyl-CoA:carnitine CoA-transferase CaiB-like acyl-CoA transferase
MTAPGALNGIRVIDLSRVLAGPLCTQTLGDLGAEVIKVERPGEGDDTRNWGPPYAGPLSAYYLGVNRNKQSVTLDLSRAEGLEILDRLIRTGDIIVENFKAGTLERWGFDDTWFEANAPQVIRCSITGYGTTGSKADRPGYDFILQAETGLMAITGEPDGNPMKLGVAIVDICAGMQATIAIMAALEARHHTGVGQRCEVNLHDTGIHILANVASNHLISGDEPGRYGNGHPNIVPYRIYRASDGDLAVAVGNDRQFEALAIVMERPEWAADPRFKANPDRVRNRAEIDRLVGEVIATKTRGEWLTILDAEGIPVGPINSVSEALSSALTAERGMVVQRDHPVAGPIAISGLPIRLSATPPSIRSDAPALGADTDEVLAGLGYTSQEISRLREAEVV